MMPVSQYSAHLPPNLDQIVRDRAAALRQQDAIRRIWASDPFVWAGADEDHWLGWLNLPTQSGPAVDRVIRFGHEIKHEGIADVILLGMGGSSLAPEVIQSIIGKQAGSPELHVLDSTDPGQILHLEQRVDLRNALILVASKSGSTLEVNILKQYFFQRMVQVVGEAEAGRRFVLTTDPGSKLERIAQDEHFREIFPGVPSVGGRYSALSNFGLVPAAAIGVDVPKILQSAEAMARLAATTGEENAAFELGVLLGVAALEGRDKPTLIVSPALASFGAWLEQLIAESLGKQGKGIIPIDGEVPGSPDEYGHDRVFVHLRLKGEASNNADAAAEALLKAGQPLIRIEWTDRYALGGEFFRWEFATAVMGGVLRVNPFDQPDVEDSKVVARRLAAEYERTGRLPQESPLVQTQAMSLFADGRSRDILGQHDTLDAYLNAFLSQSSPGDYVALLAFIEMNDAHREELQAMRMAIRDRFKVATCVGFGPRFLHSTGQAFKGGPNSGVFLQITADSLEDLPVPGQRYTFGTIKLAQARGDYEVLASRGRRLLRVHLKDANRGLHTLRNSLIDALRAG